MAVPIDPTPEPERSALIQSVIASQRLSDLVVTQETAERLMGEVEREPLPVIGMPEPPDVAAISARYDQALFSSNPADLIASMSDVPALLDALEAARAEIADWQTRSRSTDIALLDAHQRAALPPLPGGLTSTT